MHGLRCKNCSRPIPLPPATHPDTSQGLGSWPKDAIPRNFLCPECRYIYEYSPLDVTDLADDLPPDEKMTRSAKRPRSVVCIEWPCGAEKCASRLRIHTLMEFDADPKAMAPAILVLATVHEVRCGKGHTMTTVPRFGTVPLDPWFDDDWETPEM